MGLSYSALDLRHYLEESNKTWHSGKNIYYSCAPGYWFSRAAKNVPMGLIRKLQFFVKIELSFSALDLLYYWEESNETLYRGRNIYPSCAPGYWLSRAAKNVPNGTYSLFRARSPILLGYMHLGKILSSGLKMYLQDLI